MQDYVRSADADRGSSMGGSAAVRTRRSPWTAGRLGLLVGLIAGGLLGNYFSVPMFFGVDFLLGSIACLIVVSLYGIRWGLAATLISASYTLVLWHHPFGLVIFTGEVLFVGLVTRRRIIDNLGLADMVYWVLVGAPLVWGFYGYWMGLDGTGTGVILLKQCANGIFNALVAKAVLVFTPLGRWQQQPGGRRLVSLYEMSFVALALAMFLPAPAMLAWHGRQEFAQMKAEAQRHTVAALNEVLARVPRQTTAEETARVLKRIVDGRSLEVVLLDGDRNIVVSSTPRLRPDVPYDWRTGGEATPAGRDLFLWQPEAKPMSLVARWSKSCYVAERPADALFPWTVVVRQSVAPFQRRLFQGYIESLGLAVVFAFGALGLAKLFSVHLSRPISQLAEATTDLPNRLAGAQEIHWPASPIAEVDSLIGNFRMVAEGLEQSFAHMQSHAEQLHAANRRLEELYEAAEAATRAKSEFLANMSHEIRTPMTAILGFTEILLESLTEPAAREAAWTIQRNGEYLLRIINDILDLSKIEAGKLDVERFPCSPRQVVDEVVALMRVRAEAKGLPLTVQYRGPLPETIQSDPVRLRQILVNLVGNAIKFTETGEVRIAVEFLANDGDEPKLAFRVVDTGIGMSVQQIQRLFTPFSQVDSSVTRRFGGTGLGLILSKRLAAMLGGDVTVASAPGQGSTFVLTVATGPVEHGRLLDPAGQETLASTPAPSPASQPAPALCGRVLLVEDGPDNQRLIAFLLQKAGAEVTVAENGQAALEKVLGRSSPSGAEAARGEERFALILMDLQMPVVDGYEATRRLREAGYTGPIVALTAHAMSHEREKCLEAGFDDYLSKPIDRHEFFDRVARHLARCPARPPSPVP